MPRLGSGGSVVCDAPRDAGPRRAFALALAVAVLADLSTTRLPAKTATSHRYRPLHGGLLLVSREALSRPSRQLQVKLAASSVLPGVELRLRALLGLDLLIVSCGLTTGSAQP